MMLQCVAVCCSVLQCVAVVLQCVAVCCKCEEWQAMCRVAQCGATKSVELQPNVSSCTLGCNKMCRVAPKCDESQPNVLSCNQMCGVATKCVELRNVVQQNMSSCALCCNKMCRVATKCGESQTNMSHACAR